MSAHRVERAAVVLRGADEAPAPRHPADRAGRARRHGARRAGQEAPRPGRPAEHRLRAHRRPVLESDRRALRTPHRRPPAARRDVRPLLRLRLALLPVALLDLHRAVPARHAGVHQHAAVRRLRAVPGAGLAKPTFATAIQPRGYSTSMLGKSLNGYGDPAMNAFTAPIPPG